MENKGDHSILTSDLHHYDQKTAAILTRVRLQLADFNRRFDAVLDEQFKNYNPFIAPEHAPVEEDEWPPRVRPETLGLGAEWDPDDYEDGLATGRGWGLDALRKKVLGRPSRKRKRVDADTAVVKKKKAMRVEGSDEEESRASAVGKRKRVDDGAGGVGMSGKKTKETHGDERSLNNGEGEGGVSAARGIDDKTPNHSTPQRATRSSAASGSNDSHDSSSSSAPSTVERPSAAKSNDGASKDISPNSNATRSTTVDVPADKEERQRAKKQRKHAARKKRRAAKREARDAATAAAAC